jgi:outer membrane protein assembly factor BamD (BamD/ComL family)
MFVCRRIGAPILLTLLLLGPARGAEAPDDGDKPPAVKPEDAKFLEAEGLMARRMYEEAAEAYKAFMGAFPRDRRVDEAQFKTAEALRLSGDTNGALERYRELDRKAHRRLPRELEQWLDIRQGELMLIRGEPARALAVLKKPAKRARGEAAVAAQYFLGRACAEVGETDEAIRTLLSKKLITDPDYGPPALLQLGHLYAAQSAGQDAAAAWDRITESFAGSDLVVEAALLSADQHRREHRPDKARKALEALLAKHRKSPQAPAARYALAATLLASGDADGALRQAARLRHGKGLPEPARAALLTVSGVARMAKGQWGKAHEDLTRAAELPGGEPFSTLAATKRVWVLVMLNRHEEALRWADRLLDEKRVEGASADEVQYVAGLAALANNQPNQAISRFNSVAPHDSQWAPLAAWRAGEALEQVRQPGEAAKSYARLALDYRRHRFADPALLRCSAALLNAGKPAEAAERAQQLRKRTKDDELRAAALWNLALAHAAREEFIPMSRALEALLAKHEDSPHADQALYWLGWAAVKRSNPGDAQRRLQQLLERRNQDAAATDELTNRARLLLALVCQDIGEDAKAAEVLDRQFAADPAALPQDALLWLGIHHLSRGQTARAEKPLERLLAQAASLDSETRARLYLAYGEQRLGVGDWKGAEGNLDRLLLEQPDSPLATRARLMKARALRRGGELHRAHALLSNMQARGRLQAELEMELGLVARDLAAEAEADESAGGAHRRYRDAARQFMRVAILFEPADRRGDVSLPARALLAAAECYRKAGEEANAEKALRELLAQPFYRKTPFAREARDLLRRKDRR